MSGLFGFIAVVGFVGFIVALLALVRGRLRWARISNRKIAGIALAASFCVFVTGGAIAGATSGPRPNGTGVPAPITTSTTPPPATTSATTTTNPPVTTSSTTVPPTTTTTKPRPTTTVPPKRTTTVPQPPPPPSIPLNCDASMTNAQPADYTETDVIVHTGVAGAQVTTTAHYKTTKTTHSGVAGTDGSADIPYRISDATPGYTVEVDVTVVARGMSQSCGTSFTPQ